MAELPGQQATPSPIRAMPAMRLMMRPAPMISAPKSSRTTIGGYATRITPVPASAKAANARTYFFMPTDSFSLLILHFLLNLGFRFLNRSAPHLLDHFPPLLFAHFLELLLLRGIEDRHDLGIDGAADLLQLLDLLQRLERGILLQRPELFYLVLQEGENLLFLLLVQAQFDGKGVERCGHRIEHELRGRNDLVVGVAEFAAAGAIVGVTQLVNRHRVRILSDLGYDFAAFDLVRGGISLITVANRIADVAWNRGGGANVPSIHVAIWCVVDTELLTSRIVANPEGLADDHRLQLSIAQCRCTLSFEVGHRHAGGRILARIGGRRVPDRRRPGAFLSG